jgi:hypothetical protein
MVLYCCIVDGQIISPLSLSLIQWVAYAVGQNIERPNVCCYYIMPIRAGTADEKGKSVGIVAELVFVFC